MNDGGPAFPNIESDESGAPIYTQAKGMSLRDWFAGQVLAGQWTLRESEAAHVSQPTARDMASSAYRIADAMLEARKTRTDAPPALA